MSNQYLKLRRSSVPGKIPDTASLDFGEIALNTYDGLAFMKKSGSAGTQIVTIGSTSGSFTGSLQGSASYALTASYALNANFNTGSFATTGSNTFIGNQTITGSIIFNSGSRITSTYYGNNYPGYIDIVAGAPDGFVELLSYNQSSSVNVDDYRVYITTNSSSQFNLWEFKRDGRLLAPRGIEALSFTGSLLGTASLALQVSTSISTQNQQHNVLFIDTSGPGYIQVDGGLRYNPNQDLLTTTASFALTASSADNFTVRGTLTAQTIVAQTITASTEFITGSSRFGSLLTNTHQFTGSVSITSSLLVTGQVNASGITGSLFGTASWAQNAITASYVAAANVAGLSLFQITTGSITASVGIGPSNLFLINSASTEYFNISSSGNTTINSNLFIIKNFTTQKPVLTISQSIVQFATQSYEPTGLIENGSIWFTSTNLYIGLD